MSQRRIQYRVDVSAHACRVDVRQTPPAIQKGRRAEGTPREGAELGDSVPVAGDGEALSPLYSIQHAPPFIAQLPDGHFSHAVVYHR
ncbi:MAG: hypothetical protein ABL982_20025 [Vicinamibacterales bacterium]